MRVRNATELLLSKEEADSLVEQLTSFSEASNLALKIKTVNSVLLGEADCRKVVVEVFPLY